MRLAIVGTGGIARKFMRLWREIPGLTYAALCSRSLEGAGPLALEYGIDAVYTDYARLLEDEAVDTIYLALPNHLHHPYAKRAILAGKHVIVEKPFTSNDRECLELAELSQKHGVFLWEAISTPHLPIFQEIRKLLPELGKIRMLQLNYCRISSRYPALLRGEFTDTFALESSGGSLMDINIYNLHLAVGLMGVPDRAVYHPNLAQNGIDTSGTALLTYPEALCICTAAKDTDGPQGCVIQGEAGTLYLDTLPIACRTMRLAVGSSQRTIPVDPEHNNYQYEMRACVRELESRDFAACARGLEHTIRVMQLTTRLRQSAGIRFAADAV